MRAMVLEKIKSPLVLKKLPIPNIKKDEVLIKVKTCGICRTDLHVVDGELPNPKLPLIPGHQIVGNVIEIGEKVKTVFKNEKVGVPWLGYSCRTTVQVFQLKDANEALDALRSGEIKGAGVIALDEY